MMDAYKIRHNVESYRPLEIFSSYPVAAADPAGKIRIIWFNYDIPEGDEVKVITYKAFCMDEEYNVTEKDFRTEQVMEFEETEEPELEYEEYVDKLVDIIDNYSPEKMDGLLSKTEEFYLTEVVKQAIALFI